MEGEAIFRLLSYLLDYPHIKKYLFLKVFLVIGLTSYKEVYAHTLNAWAYSSLCAGHPRHTSLYVGHPINLMCGHMLLCARIVQ